MMTLQVRVNLYAFPQYGSFAETDVELSEGAQVSDLLKKMGLLIQDVGIVMVNACCGTFQQKLKSGDRITLIPHIGGG